MAKVEASLFIPGCKRAVLCCAGTRWRSYLPRGALADPAHRPVRAAGDPTHPPAAPCSQHMPPELAALRVTLPEFQQFRQMWRQLHLLSGGCRVLAGGWRAPGAP